MLPSLFDGYFLFLCEKIVLNKNKNIHYACNNWFEGLFNLIFQEIINSLTDCGWTLYDKEDETEMMDLDLEEMFRKTTLWFNF